MKNMFQEELINDARSKNLERKKEEDNQMVIS